MTATQSAPMKPWQREILRCPVTGSPLTETTDAAGQVRLESEAVSESHGGRLAYSIRDGIPVLLADEATVIP